MPATSSAPMSGRRRSWWRAPSDGSINVFENRCVHRASEFCRELSGNGQGVHLPLPSVDLRSQRQPDRHSVPPRRRRQGRHAGGFQAAGSRPAQARRDHSSRRRVRVLCRRHGIARRLSRPRSVARIRGDVRRPQAASARPLSPFAAGQLEALSRESQGPLSRHAAAHLPGDVRSAGRRQSLADARRQERTARRDGVGEIGRQSDLGRRQEGDARLQGGHDAARDALHGFHRGIRQPVVGDHGDDLAEPDRAAGNEHARRPPDRARRAARVHHEMDHVRLRRRRRGNDPASPAPGQSDGAGRLPRARGQRSDQIRSGRHARVPNGTASGQARSDKPRREPPIR